MKILIRVFLKEFRVYCILFFLCFSLYIYVVIKIEKWSLNLVEVCRFFYVQFSVFLFVYQVGLFNIYIVFLDSIYLVWEIIKNIVF